MSQQPYVMPQETRRLVMGYTMFACVVVGVVSLADFGFTSTGAGLAIAAAVQLLSGPVLLAVGWRMHPRSKLLIGLGGLCLLLSVVLGAAAVGTIE
jgi:hypothetical protein